MNQQAVSVNRKPNSASAEKNELGRTSIQSRPEQSLHPERLVAAIPVSHFSHNFSKISTHATQPACKLQAKLHISQPGDSFEQEADRVADQVMRVPAVTAPRNLFQDGSIIQRQAEKTDSSAGNVMEQRDEALGEPIAVFALPENRRQPEEETQTPGTGQASATVQRAPAGDRFQNTAPPPMQSSALTSSDGQPLSPAIRSDMEQRFGADFSAVRVHANPRSDELCRRISARAFTYQNHIHFASNEYQPASAQGKHLLAHELTHTLQQGAASMDSYGPNILPKHKSTKGMIQRSIDLSTQFDTYSLSAIRGAVPLTGGDISSVLREMENTAYASFGQRNPVMNMSVTDKWYYYNPVFTNSVYSTRSWTDVNILIPNNGYYWANDVHNFTFNYRHTATRERTGSFSVTSGSSRSRTDTLSGGAKLSYSVLELSASASTSTTTGSSASTTATTTNYYEHDYDVSLTYNLRYFNQSDFNVTRGFWGPQINQVGGPHTLTGTVDIGTCTLKDDDSNPDNLTP
jgi:hypothetical protein